MADPIAVIVARLEVWVKTVLTEIKRIHSKQAAIQKHIESNHKELSEKEHLHDVVLEEIQANRKLCESRFDDLTKHQKENSEKISTSWDKIKYTTGWGAGVLFLISLVGALIGILKYFSNKG